MRIPWFVGAYRIGFLLLVAGVMAMFVFGETNVGGARAFMLIMFVVSACALSYANGMDDERNYPLPKADDEP